uniref:Conotoxin n=2 Tax=Conus TaxID=6490 RepID=S4UJR9_CONVA|nr:T superfamily conotoxin Tx5.14 precursor [Conus textile]AGK23252.1 T superfamily conotoxin Vr5.3 precursor [Conus varius]
MLCLPVFIILLLLASPAAPMPSETNLQSDFTLADPRDADVKNRGIFALAKSVCCTAAKLSFCC